MDFAPRNVLISEDEPSCITGLLDVEFAGFFPEEEEFINAVIKQEGDWEERHWEVIMQEMARLGETVPPTLEVQAGSCFDEVEWRRACAVARVIDRMAPWEVRDGEVGEDDLVKELNQAEGLVRAGLMELRVLREALGC